MSDVITVKEQAMEAPQHLVAALTNEEELRIYVPSQPADLVVTTSRVVVADERGRVALAVPFEGLRRIQLDVERSRPATLVIVPERPRDEPQVLTIASKHYREVAEAVVAIGVALGWMDPE